MTFKRSAFLLAVIYLGYVSLGLPDGTLGVAWPVMHAELKLPIGLAGTITLIVTLLSGVSGFSSGRVISRLGTGPVMLWSGALTGFALLGFSAASNFFWLVVAAVPLGFGAGAVDSGLNGFVAKHYSGRHMNWLHACWGVGATCGPLAMGHAMRIGWGWRNGYMLLAAAQLTLALLFLATLKLWAWVPVIHSSKTSAAGAETKAPVLGSYSFAAWLSPAMLATYTAVEVTAGLWAASILVESRGLASSTAAGCVAGYFGAITGGRVLVGIVVDRCGNRRIIALGILLSLAGALAFTQAMSPTSAAVALAIMGFGFAPIYPGLMHEVPKRFAPSAVQTIVGRQSGAGFIGVATLPAMAGWVAQHSLEYVPLLLLAGIVVMLAGIRWLDRITPWKGRIGA